MRASTQDFPGWTTLSDLVQRLADSRYAGGLFGYTSMSTLALLQTQEYAFNQERLLIRPAGGQLHFAFTDAAGWNRNAKKPPTLRGEPSWVHEYPESEAWPAVERFFDRVGWFPKYLTQPKDPPG